MRLPAGLYNRMVARGLVRELPTSRLYFLNYLEHLPKSLRASASYIGPNVFAIGRRAFIVRQTSAFGLRQARKLDKVFYIVDDNFKIGSEDETLPADYRIKLRMLHDEAEFRILDICDGVICANASAAEAYRRREGLRAVHTMHPHYGPARPHPPASRARAVHLALLQTRSHLNDVRSIAEPLNAILARYPETSLMHFLKGFDTGLAPSKRIVEGKPLAWRAYMRWRKRIDIGLYPLLDGGFNRYRSINKFLEYVHRGATPLIADNPAMRDLPERFRVKDGDWYDTLAHYVADPEARDAAYRQAQAFIEDMRFFDRSLETLKHLVEA